MEIVLIGAGNVATQLGLALKEAGYSILQVYSRTKKSADILAKNLKAKAITNLIELNLDASIYIIAINDDLIVNLTKQLKLKDKLVIHTSGTTEMSILKKVSGNYGVFYPIQTFLKSKKVDFKKIPVCIEANNKYALSEIKKIAEKISQVVVKMNSTKRKQLHLAAVFANNFTNHLFAIAKTILNENNLSFDLLLPLIDETINKIKNGNPEEMQTGPAIRRDKKTMIEHLQLLSTNKEYKKIYRLMSQSIIDSTNTK